MPADPGVAPDASAETALDLLLRRTHLDPTGEVVRFVDGPSAGERVSAAALVVSAARAAARFEALGVRAGDVVLTWLPATPTLLATWFGLAACGAVEVPLAVGTTDEIAERTLGLVAPRWAVVDETLLAAGVPGAAALTRWRRSGGGMLAASTDGDAVPIDLAARAAALDPLAPAVAMGTSGTTGRSKAALLPHAAGARQAKRVALTMGYGADDVLLNVFPWHHINARHSAFLAALHAGSRLVVADRFSTSRFWAICREQEVTAFNFMGAMTSMLQRAPVGPDDRAHRVTRAYGAPAPAHAVEEFEARFGVRLLESYASTELADVTANTVDRARPGTAGAVLPEYELALRDPDGHEVAAGAVGTVHVRPRRPGVAFLGYLGDPVATAETIAPGGWIRTGDLARLDADGFLVHTGRRSDVIRRRGENIAAAEVAETVAALPGVNDVAVVGVASPLGEQEVALTVASHAVTPADVHAWCLARLPRHALPRYVRIVDEIPLNRSLKVDLARLGRDDWLTAATVFDPPARVDRADDRDPAR